jgi:hypothetical protein
MDDRRRVIARWQEAETKIYPLVMMDARGYQEAVAAVGSVLELLRRRASDFDALCSLAEQPDDLTQEAEVAELPGSLTAAIVVDAACAIRHRELEAEVTAGRWLHAVRSGRAAGDDWAEVHDAASALGLLGVPELRVAVGSGRGVHTSLSLDPNTADQVLLLTPIHVDIDRGRAATIDDMEPCLVACDLSAWRSAASALIDQLLDPTR